MAIGGGTGFTTIEICRLMGLVDKYDRVIGDTHADDWEPLPEIGEEEIVRMRRLGRKRAKAAVRGLLGPRDR
jgi:hypothetical protein